MNEISNQESGSFCREKCWYYQSHISNHSFISYRSTAAIMEEIRL